MRPRVPVGIRLEEDGLASAEQSCLAHEDARARRRERDAQRHAGEDLELLSTAPTREHACATTSTGCSKTGVTDERAQPSPGQARRSRSRRGLKDAKKPERRARRLAKFVAMLEAGETIYPWSERKDVASGEAPATRGLVGCV
jgi:hypothetical protein